MDSALFDIIHDNTPMINPDIANGLAMKAMDGVERYIDKIIRSASPGFPEGLVYGWASKGGIGYERCTPYEEYNRTVAKKMNRSNFELARSDLYMIKLYFTFKGVELEPRYIYLPYVRDGGIISLRGSTYSISPVLADQAISLGLQSMFVILPRAKLTFERKPHHFMADGERQTYEVVYARVHNERRQPRRNGQRPTVFGNTTMVHYLLCKYGITETFKRYVGADIVVGDSKTLNEKTHPPEDWTICSSTKFKPRSLRTKYYVGSDLRIGIRNEDYGFIVRNMVAGVFYVVDHFPERVQPEYTDHLLTWRRLLGHLIKGGIVDSEGKLIEYVAAHFDSLDEYIDEEAQDMLKDDGVPCQNLYDLFFHAIKVLSVLEVQSLDRVASMYGKSMMILRYALFDVTSAIFNFMYQLKKNTRTEVTEKDVTDTMRRILTPELIMKLNHDHGEVNSVSSPGDNKHFKITSNLVQQTSSTGKGKSKQRSTLVDPSKFLHPSLAEIGSYGVLPKSSPTGQGKINPFQQLSENYRVMQDPKYQDILQDVAEKTKR